MSYEYAIERDKLFTDEGQRTFLTVRDHVKALLHKAGAVRMCEAISQCTGDTWLMLAAVDRLVELGELREISQGNVPGQHRVFVAQ